MAAARGCSLDRSRLAASDRTVASSMPGAGDHRCHPRLALGQRPGLVDHQRVHLLEPLQGLGVLDQHARGRPLADADHDGHGRRQPERAGAGDDQDRHGRDQPIGEGGARPPDRPGDEGQDRDQDHRRDEPSGDHVRQPLDRRPAALGLGDHGHDARQHGVRADLFGPHHQGAGLVHRAADHLRAGLLRDRHGLAGHHGLVHGAAALQHLAIDGHAIAGPHPQAVAGVDGFKRHLLVLAVGPEAARRLRRQIQQRPDRAAGLLARPKLQHLPQQHQHGDHGRRLVVDGNQPLGIPEARREDSRQERRDEAEQVGHADAERYQAEHVQPAAHERPPSPLQQRPARPQDHGRRQQELKPQRRLRGDQCVEPKPRKMGAHFQEDERRRQGGADPEPPGHVREFGVRLALDAGGDRLQSHAADRAVARPLLTDLGVHGAGVDNPRLRRGLPGLLRGGWLWPPASGTAPGRRRTCHGIVPSRSGTWRHAGVMLSPVRVHRHAADGVLHRRPALDAGQRGSTHASRITRRPVTSCPSCPSGRT